MVVVWQAESGLLFAGFMIVDCPLKKDSRDVIKALQVGKQQGTTEREEQEEGTETERE